MKLLKKPIAPNSNIFLISDDHEGSQFRYDKGWDQMCHMVNSEWNGVPPVNNYVVDGGDFMEAIAIDDRRYGPETDKETVPDLQVEAGVKNREPIKDHIVTILDGNHPLKLWKFGMLTARLCRMLSVPYGTYTAKISWTDKRGNVKFKSFHRHGAKSITSTADDPKRRKANMELILKRHLREASGDAILMCKSHTHKLLVCRPEPPLYLTDDGKHIHAGYAESPQNAEYIPPDLRWYVNTGSFLRMYNVGSRLSSKFGDNLGVSGYAERYEYDPIELGFAIAEIRDWKLVEIRKIKLSAGHVGRKVSIEIDPPL